jgi:hypothetical protein
MSRLVIPGAQWLATARKLRQVRKASLQFLDRWAISHLLSDDPALDRVVEDIDTQAVQAKTADSHIRGPEDNDWSYLYRGSVLDD